MIKGTTEGESISVWFMGTRRDAWVAESLKQKTPQYLNIGEPHQCFLIIICEDSLFPTAEDLQQFAKLPMLREIETTRTVPINHDDADGTPADGKEVQICDVYGRIEKFSIECSTEGELIKVWFKGRHERPSWRDRASSHKTLTPTSRRGTEPGYQIGTSRRKNRLRLLKREISSRNRLCYWIRGSGNEYTLDTTDLISEKSGLWLLGTEFWSRTWPMEVRRFEVDYVKSMSLCEGA
ncbi:hypothetical protein VC83_01629 [Pseudogymnoascus destructans]|uniref:Uncharacterized protein n=2 Tax=Pseudogymnoascus destructans TaxID=655981 RepID=L8G7Y7_PSED2|nr:uncharacterized protein VC83_01629 [Pseudogymnoascus destructans]ELR08101.1 hypothetical protein GMDG_02928 [Pseudogymnoascus destructans 20631-21]OAF61826.1 hypothetical protein VC83_01629 [Pseudogymnoascus destructans]